MDITDNLNEEKENLLKMCLWGFLVLLVLILISVPISKILVNPLEESISRQSEFIRMAEHELKTPLSVMQTSLCMLEKDGVNSKYLNYAREENEKKKRLVAEMLELSKAEGTLDSGNKAVGLQDGDGGHVTSEVLGESLSLYVDRMYAKYVDGAVTTIEKAEAENQTKNGDSEEASGTDLSGWVTYEDGTASFTLAAAVAYRTNGASKAMPGFDVMDYGQEDYVFGTSEVDARHWDKFVLEIFKEHADVLSELFNQG